MEQTKLKAAICKSGHLQSSTLKKEETLQGEYCRECGLAIIDHCQECNTMIIGGKIREKLVSYNGITGGDKTYRTERIPNNFIPKYCHSCGKPYPWTITFLAEYKELLELQSTNIDKETQEKIYSTVSKVITEKDVSSSISFQKLKSLLQPIVGFSKEILVNSLSQVLTGEITKKLY